MLKINFKLKKENYERRNSRADFKKEADFFLIVFHPFGLSDPFMDDISMWNSVPSLMTNTSRSQVPKKTKSEEATEDCVYKIPMNFRNQLQMPTRRHSKRAIQSIVAFLYRLCPEITAFFGLGISECATEK